MGYMGVELHIAIEAYIKVFDRVAWYNVGVINLDRSVTRNLCSVSSSADEFTLCAFSSCLT